jgi:hypothetical protein
MSEPQEAKRVGEPDTAARAVGQLVMQHMLLYAVAVNPATINQLIAAGAGVVGAIVGASGTLLTARIQHRFTIEAERKRETQAREKRAAEKCDSLVTQLAKLVRQGVGHGEDDEAATKRAYKMIRLDEEILSEEYYLPVEVRRQVDVARSALVAARSLHFGRFYLDPTEIAAHVIPATNQLLSAFVRNEPLPEWSEVMTHLAVALDEQEDQLREEYTEDLSHSSDAKYQWLVDHPQIRTSEPDA